MRKQLLSRSLLSGLLAILPLCGAQAEEAKAPTATSDDLITALDNGSFWLDSRYRYETVHQAGIAREAQANTVRTILGYNSGVFHGVKLQFAGLNNMQIGNDTFNDSTNGRSNYPTVGDPIDTQLYLANFNYTGVKDTDLTVGRQQFQFDNQRFVGQPGWRQISQTYDAILLKNKSISDLELAYGFVLHQNRSGGSGAFNGSYGMATHLFHAAYTGIKNVKAIGYSYLIDIENLRTTSSATHGLRMEAKQPLFDDFALTGTAEYARQTDYGNNPNSYALNYYLLEPGISWGKLKGKFAYEYMGGNGRVAMQTPMASAHGLTGWSDKFPTIPVNGLENAYVEVSYTFKPPVEWLADSKITAQWHDLNAVHISRHYGNDWGLDFVQNIDNKFSVGVQYENYIADSYLTDTQKVIVTGQIKF